MKRLLITGFDPFGGETRNPSWEAVRLLPDVILSVVQALTAAIQSC